MAEEAADVCNSTISTCIPPPSDERKWKTMPMCVFFKDARHVLKKDELGMEILRIAFPAALALAADPLASLIDTAFIGRLGSVEIAAVGVAIAIFNQASKVTIFPLLNITTSFVAQEETVRRLKINEERIIINTKSQDYENSQIHNSTTTEDEAKVEDDDDDIIEKLKMSSCKSVDDTPMDRKKGKAKTERRQISSASTALAFGAVLGLLQTLVLIFLAKPFLAIMGVKSGSPMLSPALKYLTIRSVGAPAVLLSLAMQGVYRGFKDTTTPLYAIVIGDVTNIILDPILIFGCGLGVSGAAIAHVLSQYLISLILLLKLMKQVDLLPPSIKDLQFSKFLKSFVLLIKVIAATVCVTLAASKAARLGPTRMAAFQICLQLWLTLSLIGDALAVAGQAILACAFAEKDYNKATAASARVLQMGFVLGLGLAVFIGVGLPFGSGIFTKDKNVMHLIAVAVPFVAGTQPINLIAFVFDGINSGSCDFGYSAYSMVVVSIATIGAVFVLSKTYGFIGIWLALTIFMGLRTIAGILRMATASGPWRYLRVRSMPSNV
ncbi:MATE efflux family protein [Perilla frutescens var. frutescens]|nr:MATE efflux family protein [Perilla frutescens var. frutescens]